MPLASGVYIYLENVLKFIFSSDIYLTYTSLNHIFRIEYFPDEETEQSLVKMEINAII